MKNLELKWKAVPCFAGPECWCSMIVTEAYDEKASDPALNDAHVVIGASCINDTVAKYLVYLHNKSIRPSAETQLRKSLNNSKMVKS